MKISYLYKEKSTGICYQGTNIKVFTYGNEKYFIVLNIGKYLIALDTVPKRTLFDIPLRSDTSQDRIKHHFKERRRKSKEEYSCLRFKADIIDFCFDDNCQNAYVLTVDGQILFLSIKKLVDRFMTPSGEFFENVSSDVIEELSLTKEKYQVNSEDALRATPIQLPCVLQPGNLYINLSSSLNILLMEKGNLKMFTTNIVPSDGSLEIKQTAFHQLFKNINFNNIESAPQLFFLSCSGNSQNISVSPVLCERLFDANTKLLSCLIFASLPSGSIFHVRSGSSGKKLKLICDLKQPLIYVTCMSINEIRHDTIMDTIYESIQKAEIEKLIQSFREKSANDCLLFIGKLGKLMFLAGQDDSIESKKISFEYQLPLPIAACTSKKDLLLVSDFKVINIFKIFIVVKLKREYNDVKELLKKMFVPEHELIYTISVPNIIGMEILETDPFILCCVNNKMNVLRIEIEQNLKARTSIDDLSNLIKKLEGTHLSLHEVMNKSKNLNSNLRQLKTIISACHKIHKPVISCENQQNLDITFTFQNIHHKSKYKLLVFGKLFNNTTLTLVEDWYVTIIYYQKYQPVSIGTEIKVKSRTECFMSSSLNPSCCYEFNFLIDPTFFTNYSDVNIDVYVDHSFKYIFNNYVENKPNCGGVSLYIKSCTTDIMKQCIVVDKIIAKTISRISRKLDLKYYLEQNDFGEREYFCLFLVPISRTKYLQKLCDMCFDKPYACDSIANLLYKYLLIKVDNVHKSNCNLTLIHLSGVTLELSVEDNGGSSITNTFMLKVRTHSLTLLIAVHHFIFDMFKDSILEGKEFKEAFDLKLIKLQELKRLCDTMAANVNEIDDDKLSQQELLVKMHDIYVNLRKFVL